MILFDFQTFINQKYGGISTYYSELISNLSSRGVNCQLALDFSENYSFNNKLQEKTIRPKIFNSYPNLKSWLFGLNFKGKGRLFKLFFGNEIFQSMVKSELRLEFLKKYTIRLLETKEFRIFHPTYFSNYYLDSISTLKIPYVITVYDLIHELFPDIFVEQDEVKQNRFVLCNKASKILAISESTKQDLIRIYDINPSKIIVTPLAVSWIESKYEEPEVENYILFVGDRWNYKNFKFLLLSISEILKIKGIKLICIGSLDFSQEELSYIEELELEQFVFHVPFSNSEELKKYYRFAKLFVFPSLYEGFGLPILEAQSQRTPIACSNKGSLPEVAGNGAVYFDPYDKTSIFNVINEILDRKSLQQSIVKEGILNFRRFSWQNTSSKTLDAYREFL